MVVRILSFNKFLVCSCIGIVFFTNACGTGPVSAGAQIQAQPTCTSSTPEANPYLSHSQSDAVKIYENYRFGLISYDSTRQDALSQLGKNTEHWSDQVDIAIDENNMVRIVVTYLDPVLIQYIVLNHVMTDPNNPMGLVDFDNELKARVGKLGERNEMLFIVTITSPFYREQAFNSNVLTVNIPIQQMALISASGMQVIPAHVDPILNQNIDITHGPVSGIAGYPIAVLNQNQCTWIMDQWTNTLTLSIPGVTLGSTEFGSQFWSIPYRSLVMQDDKRPTATFDPYYDWSRISKIVSPPTPNWKPNAQIDDTIWKNYWEDMGRYIWDLVITESLH